MNILVKTIKDISLIHLIVQIILALGFGAVTYYMNAIILKTFNINLPFSEWFGLGCINTVSNYFFPMKSGTLVKALYLKKKYDFNISKSFSVLVFASFIFFEIIFLLSAILLTCIIFFLNKKIIFLKLLIILLYSFFFIGIIAIYIIKHMKLSLNGKSKIKARFINIFNIFNEGLCHMIENIRLLFIMIILNIVLFSIEILRFYFAFYAIGSPLSLFTVAYVNVFNLVAGQISITPGNLGIQEVIISISSEALGLSLEQGLVAATFIRIVGMCLFCGLGCFWLIYFKYKDP